MLVFNRAAPRRRGDGASRNRGVGGLRDLRRSTFASSSGAVPAGFTASLLIMTFLSGVQLLFLGIIGEYLGRVYGEAKGRPPYVVARVLSRRAGDVR